MAQKTKLTQKTKVIKIRKISARENDWKDQEARENGSEDQNYPKTTIAV